MRQRNQTTALWETPTVWLWIKTLLFSLIIFCCNQNSVVYGVSGGKQAQLYLLHQLCFKPWNKEKILCSCLFIHVNLQFILTSISEIFHISLDQWFYVQIHFIHKMIILDQNISYVKNNNSALTVWNKNTQTRKCQQT